MDLSRVIDELAALDPGALTEAQRLDLVGSVRRLAGRRALLRVAPDAPPAGSAARAEVPTVCCEHAAAALLAPEGDERAARLAPHHPALRRRARPALTLVPSPA